MHIHCIIHESFESPGAIVSWAEENNHTLSYTKCYQLDVLPDNIETIDFLIIMGGPQSPATTKEECHHFDVKAETVFISKAIQAGKYVLGVCLGAQLIGEALGAQFEHSPNKEIGVFDTILTDDGRTNPLFENFPLKFPVGHWHGDMPGLTSDAKILAFSEGCPRQIVEYTPKVYGFQCHFEFTKETIDEMILHSIEELKQYENLPYVQQDEELKKHEYSAMNKLLFSFLDKLTA